MVFEWVWLGGVGKISFYLLFLKKHQYYVCVLLCVYYTYRCEKWCVELCVCVFVYMFVCVFVYVLVYWLISWLRT